MEKLKVDSTDDIAEERYKGPGPVVASAGYIYISHLAATVVGALALGTLGYFASSKTVAVKEAFTRMGEKYGSSNNWLVKAPASVIGAIPKFSEWMVAHIPGANKISGHSAFEDKQTAVVFASGIGAAVGWVGSTIWGLLKGGHEGNVGKRQHDRLVAEVKNLRETNDDLEKINDDLHAKYVEASTTLDDMRRTQKSSTHDASVASADTMAAAPEQADDAAESLETPQSKIQPHDETHGPEHLGKVHAHAQAEQAAHAQV
ncbi:MAG: hypothetical protein K2X09_04815 [Rickettsiales bacterium]|nr:hypothetical protein [Rickettsiales bacterium]